MTTKRVTRRGVSVEVMTEMADRPMDEVLPVIVERSHAAGFMDFDLSVAAKSYRFLVRQGMAPGSIPEKVKKAKPVKKAKAKIEVAQTAKATPKTETKVEITDPEKAAVVAANTQRLLAYRAKQKAKEQDEARKVDADEQHRSERFDTSFDDPYSSPDSLTTDQVSALTGY